MAATYGTIVVNSVLADSTTPLEDVNTSRATASCNLFLCWAVTFADKTANVQRYTTSQTIHMFTYLLILYNTIPS
jgi:hypothetical protein